MKWCQLVDLILVEKDLVWQKTFRTLYFKADINFVLKMGIDCFTAIATEAMLILAPLVKNCYL
jgi:hypothetical protein